MQTSGVAGVYSGTMCCGINYEYSCPFASDGYRCYDTYPASTYCDNPLMITTTFPTSDPTIDPTIDPTTHPTDNPKGDATAVMC